MMLQHVNAVTVGYKPRSIRGSDTAMDSLPYGEACSADVYGLHNPTGLQLDDDLQPDRRGSDMNVLAI